MTRVPRRAMLRAMYGLLALALQALAGLAGGALAAVLVRARGRPLRRLLAGAGGGIVGDSLLAAVFNGMADPAELAALGAVDPGTLLVQLAGATFAGGVATGLAARLARR